MSIKLKKKSKVCKFDRCLWSDTKWNEPYLLYDPPDMCSAGLTLPAEACAHCFAQPIPEQHGLSTQSLWREPDPSEVRCSHVPSKQSQAVKTSEFTASVYTVQ